MNLLRLSQGLRQRVRGTEGYTIDQTILIVAIIAILVTMIIITVGWNLINKSSGTKMASQMRQFEDANGQFYAAYRTWPHQAYGTGSTVLNDTTNNIRALQGNTTLLTGSNALKPVVTSSPDGVKNFLPGFRDDGTNIKHNFGSGGIVLMRGDNLDPFGLNGRYMIIQFSQVPFSEAQTAERAIDGEQNENYASGRVVATTAAATNCVTGGTVSSPATTATAPSALVNACYAANLLQ